MDPSATDDDLRPVLDELRKFEGLVQHFYLVESDDGTPGVTLGIGCLITSADQARALPFYHLDGTPAAPDEVAAEFDRVQSASLGHAPAFYSGAILMTVNDAYDLGCARLRASFFDLADTFPAWGTFPLGPWQCLLDLHWNCGSLRHGWPRLLAACNAVPPDWQAASENCTTANPKNSPARAARNAWRVERMRSAIAQPVVS